MRSHHEHFDGSGYPDGLAGEQIPIAARIVAAADAFVAMTESRPYEGPRGHREALAELRAQLGSQFDPRVVDALVAVLEHEQRGRPGARRADAHATGRPYAPGMAGRRREMRGIPERDLV